MEVSKYDATIDWRYAVRCAICGRRMPQAYRWIHLPDQSIWDSTGQSLCQMCGDPYMAMQQLRYLVGGDDEP